MTNGLPASEIRPRSEVAPIVSFMAAGPISFLRAAWDRWKKIAHAVGVVQTRILMVIFYFIVVYPLGLIMKRTGDPLHLTRPRDSNWTAHRQEEPGIDTARRQF